MTERVQLEEMVTPKMVNHVLNSPLENQLDICIKTIQKYGYPEYALTESFLNRNGERLLSLLEQLDELIRTKTTMISEDGG